MAEMLRVSYETMIRFARDGTVPAFKVGWQWRFFPSKVIAHLEAEAQAVDPWVLSPQAIAAQRRTAAKHAGRYDVR